MRASKPIACACALWLALCGPVSAVTARATPDAARGPAPATPPAHVATPDAETYDYAPAVLVTEPATKTSVAAESPTKNGVNGPAPGVAAPAVNVATPTANVAVPPPAPAAQQSPAPKKQNAFLRIITAPFRGLAKLLGGDGTRRRTAGVRVEEIKRPETKQDAATRQDAATKQDATAGRNATAKPGAQSGATGNMNASAGASPAQPGAVSTLPHVARPAPSPQAAAVADDEEELAPFVPLIVGVPRDPISQGRALLEQGYLNEAISELSVAAATGVQLAEANNLLGLAHDRAGRHEQAREYYERALSVAPGDPHVLNNIGHSLYLSDRNAEALAKLKEAARLRPSDATINNNLGLVYGRLRKYGDSLRHFRVAGGEFYARMRTGELLEAAGRDRDAIKHFEAARRAAPDSSDALRRLITLYRRTGQRDKAEAAQRELDRPKTKASDSTSG
jgi:Flp pilus assembly protein TadD